MLKVVHFADLHLGVESYGRLDPATGLSSRLSDFLGCLDEMVEYCLAGDVDLVIFCGDAYRNRDPSQTHQREFAKRMEKLSAHGITVFLLVGNHDLPYAIGRANSVEIFDTLSVKNIFVASKPGTYRIKTKIGLVQIVALPWARRNVLLTKEDSKNLTVNELNDKLQQILTGWLSNEVEALDPGLPAILSAHVYISTARTGSEKSMMVGQDYVLLHSNIIRPEFDYIALGHIHRHQVLSDNPPAVYAGSLERIDFGDENDEKGFYVITIDEKRKIGERIISYDFHKVNARRFLTIKVNADTDDPTATVINVIHRNDINDAIVRLEIKVSPSREVLIRDSEIRRALNDAYFVGSILKDIERERLVRLSEHSAEELTPMQALNVYLQSKQIPVERIKKLLDYGRQLISGADEDQDSFTK